MPRIVVLGTSGAGKSTVAGDLSRIYGCPHVDLDDLARGPNWQRVSDEEFQRRVHTALAAPEWIIDGDYQRKLGDDVLKRAETAIWLDLPLRVSLARMWKRTSHRIRNQVELSHGNRMSWNLDLLRWLQREVRSHVRRRLKMPRRLGRYSQLNVVRLRSQRQVDEWLAEHNFAHFAKLS